MPIGRISMKTKYFSNTGEQTLEDLKVIVNKWIATRKNIQVIEIKTSDPSKSTPPEYFMRLTYDDKMPPRIPSSTVTPVAKRRS